MSKRTAIAAMTIAVLVVGPALATLRVPLGPDELGALLYPLKMSEGLVIHRDFFSPYGPGTYRLVQAAFELFGPSVTIERLIGIAYHLLIALAVFALARPLGWHSAVAAGLTCAGTFLWFTPAAYAWFGGLALAVSSLALLANSRRQVTAVVAGGLAGLIPFWRPEMAVLWLAAIPLCVVTRRTRSYSLGIVLGLVPTAAHLAVAGSSLIDGVFVSRLSVNGQTTLTNVDAKVWVILGLCVLGIGHQLWLSRTDASHRALLLSTATLSVLMMPQALQRTDIYHAIFAACVILPLSAAAIVSGVEPSLLSRALAPLRVATAAIAVVALAATGSLLIARLPLSSIETAGRTLPAVPATRDRLTEAIRSLRAHVAPGSRVFMGSQDMSRYGVNDNDLYYLLPEFRSPFFYLEMAPGASERKGSRLVQDLMSSDALVLRDTPKEATDSEFPHIGPGSQDANEVVRNYFCLVDTVGISQIYVRGRC